MSDDRPEWQRVGVIVPSSNTIIEADFARALPAGVTVQAQAPAGDVKVLIVYHTVTGNTEKMAQGVAEGAAQASF